jgi:two-component system sensor histidine kinase/response regulator
MFKRAFIFAVFFSVFGQGFAQSTQVDSLESLVKSVPADTTKVWLLNELVSSLIDHRGNSKALHYAREAKDLAALLNYGPGLAKALELLGWIHYRKGDYATSFEFSNEALKINGELNNKSGIARCLISLAAVAYEQKYYPQAIVNFKKAYVLSREVNDTRTMARCLNNLAFNFVNLKQLDSASYYLKDAMVLSLKADDLYMVGFASRTQGDVLFARQDYNNALKKFISSLVISEKTGNNFLRASTLHRLGKTYHAMGQSEKALSYLLADYEFARRLDYNEELERTSKMISNIYLEQGDFKKAHQFQSVYLAVHDSLYAQRKDDQLMLMQASFDSEIKQTQIELLTKDTQLKEEEIKSQKVWMYFYIGLLALVVFLVLVLFMSNYFNKKAKRQLEHKNLEIQRQAQQLTDLNATKDKLFSIIGHDLRSPVASLKGLMEIIGSGNLTQDEFIEVTQKLKKNLDLVYDDLDNVLQWAQSQLKGIQVQREEVPLRALSEEIVSLFHDALRSKRILVLNELDEDSFVLADRNQLKLVLRNLIANSIKFNELGGMIRLSMKYVKSRVEVSVADSGIGIGMDELNKLFNAETHFTKLGTNKEKGVGIGLLLTKEFVESNGGSIWVTSVLGKGATFTFTLQQALVEKRQGVLSPSL